ncbi:uncharacterized protein LOC126379626 [Pectinophora gossypiella]|uniref:uncharacterized protein LOC126379626 n=1 Tax=Pectinophora gossypiella TaxID=13191 RepID=UPI00214F3912|nr:uncharacterized protein LOC126379626 [Pectinophora gossypiella]
MAYPALRQPKFLKEQSTSERKQVISDVKYVILTLCNGIKLVITSDSYNSIIIEEDTYKCVLCGMSMELDNEYKELHKNSHEHKNLMTSVPYVEEFPESLMRKIDKHNGYCTICNVIVPSHAIAHHVDNNVHVNEFEKAVIRASIYKPY